MISRRKTGIILVSILGTVALFSLGFIIWKESGSLRKRVSLTLNRYQGDYVIQVLKGFEQHFPSIIPVCWEGVMTNNGSIPVRIVSYTIDQINPDYPHVYRRMMLGMYHKDNMVKEIEFPITIEPDHSLEFYVKTGILIHSRIDVVLREKYPVTSRTKLSNLLDYLAEKKIDLFGNPVEMERVAGGGYLYTIPEKERQQEVFIFSLKTSREESIKKLFTPY